MLLVTLNVWRVQSEGVQSFKLPQTLKRQNILVGLTISIWTYVFNVSEPDSVFIFRFMWPCIINGGEERTNR